MRVRCKAPVRIDLAGGWSDVAEFADVHGGAVTNLAMDSYVTVEVSAGRQTIHLAAEDLGQHVTVPSSRDLVYNGELDLHKAALNMFPVLGGAEVISNSEVPRGSGLGASGSLDVALLAALSTARNEEYTKEELAELGYELETAELDLKGGRQDQYAAALGGINLFRFDSAGISVERLELAPSLADDLEAHMLVAYTGQSHFSPATHDHVWSAFREGDDRVIGAIATMRDLALEAADCLLAGSWEKLAGIVDRNWQAQQQLHATIRSPNMARIEDEARKAGAWGCKAAGAGAGGCLIFLVPPDRSPGVSDAVVAAGGSILHAKIDQTGVQVWKEEDVAVDGS